MENIRFIVDLAREGTIKRIDFNFVVQTENYREMGDFVGLHGFGSVDKIFSAL